MKRFMAVLFLCFLLAGCSASNPGDRTNTVSPTDESTNNTVIPTQEAADLSLPVYPENFFEMSGEPIDFGKLPKPKLLYTHEGANGTVNLLDYGILNVVSLVYGGEDHFIEYDFKDPRFVTSEGISVGSAKVDVQKAYGKYGITEYMPDKLPDFNVLYSSVVVLDDEKVSEKFLYVDNRAIFKEGYKGIDYWDGLGAYIFIFDKSDNVKMIIRNAPTSG